MNAKQTAAYGVFVLLLISISAVASAGGKNLVINGSFDDRRGPLTGWKSKYPSHLQRAYKNNHKYVSVEERVSGRRNVLKLECDAGRVIHEGVKVDAYPIKYKPGQRFQLSARAKSTGPKCRFLVQGFRWRPDVEPHEHPKFEELRRVYRFGLLYFNKPESGSFSHVSTNGRWEHGRLDFPDREQTELGQSFLEKVDFIMIHIVAIDGEEGALYIDDVKIKQIN